MTPGGLTFQAPPPTVRGSAPTHRCGSWPKRARYDEAPASAAISRDAPVDASGPRGLGPRLRFAKAPAGTAPTARDVSRPVPQVWHRISGVCLRPSPRLSALERAPRLGRGIVNIVIIGLKSRIFITS